MSLLNKAASQLPKKKGKSINVVAITGVAPDDISFRALMEEDLGKHQHIDAIAYANLTGEISVHSLKSGMCDRLQPLFRTRRADHFQLHYEIFHHRAQKAARDNARTNTLTGKTPTALESQVIQSLPAQRVIRGSVDADPYRMAISSRESVTNEPRFEIIPSHLPKS